MTINSPSRAVQAAVEWETAVARAAAVAVATVLALWWDDRQSRRP